MSFKMIFALSALVLGACSTATPPSSMPSEALTLTLKQKSGKIMKQYLACITPSLQKQYPTFSITPVISTLYEGKVPGTEANQPLASFEIEGSTDKIETSVTLLQVSPIDKALTRIFEDCL